MAAEPVRAEDNTMENFSSQNFDDEFIAKMCQEPFPKEIIDVLLAPLDINDVAAKPGFGGQGMYVFFNLPPCY
jgi:hypothetical protein